MNGEINYKICDIVCDDIIRRINFYYVKNLRQTIIKRITNFHRQKI